MGTMVFALPQNLDSAQTAAKVINVIIFVGASIEIVLKALPMLAKSNHALANLSQLEADLDDAARTADHPPSPQPKRTMARIEGRALAYTYTEESSGGGRTFSVGPCDITVEAGEILFIVGGNGSGKSTLVRLLTRLYEPQGGSLFWDGVVVDRRNAADFRNLFAVIFADFHLFDRLYGLDEPDAERVPALLAEMDLDRKTDYLDRHFTSLDLSTGQRKRLAMVAARLENKPICVFDEWAADQDPVFRRYFYEVLLPTLRAEGRTVIAVTHDDRYFSAADRVLVMEEGQIIREEARQ
jgi:putative ATP-binding cassette transporter